MKLVLVIWLIVCIAAVVVAEDQGKLPPSCVTPNQDLGICIDIRNCTIFIDAITSGKHESYRFIRESECGTVTGKIPKVCCGKYINYVEQRTNIENISETDSFSKDCGRSQTIGFKIYGGNESQLDQFPWMARLRHQRSDGLLSYGCLGFLISEKFVLTAAHCIYSTALVLLGPIFQVQLGEHNTKSDPDCNFMECAEPPQFLRTEDPIVHPDYSNDSQHHHDIALIPLKEPAKLTRFVRHICISRVPTNETEFWLSGWGKTETETSSSVKLQVLVPRVNHVQCSNLFKTRGLRVMDFQICAGGVEGKDSCAGDSGGPLMVDKNDVWYAEGIVSVGTACGQTGWPAIYTYIPKYVSWIESEMNRYLKKHNNKNQKQENIPTTEIDNRFVWN